MAVTAEALGVISPRETGLVSEVHRSNTELEIFRKAVSS